MGSMPQNAGHKATDQRRVSDPLPKRAPRTQSPTDTAGSAPTRTPISPRRTDIKLRQKLSESLTSGDKQGVVYILKDEARPELGLKIGSTSATDYQDRIKQHANDCFFNPSVVLVSVEVKCCVRAERLVQLDLEERLRTWVCNDHAKRRKAVDHREWFSITEDEAKETVVKWTKFINAQQPYWFGHLSPLWAYLLRTRKLPDVDDIDHETRRKQWHATLATLAYLDYYHFTTDMMLRAWRAAISIILRIWPYFTGFFWQMLTLIYGFITLIAFRNTFASSAFALVSVCACFSVGPKLLKKLSKS